MEENTETIVTATPPLPCEFDSFQQWELAFIYAFACTFNPHQKVAPAFYKLPDFTPQELELEIQKEKSDLVNQIICASLGNILNRKNPIESFKISLSQLVTDKIKAFELDLDANPLSKLSFNSLTTSVKLYLLHSMIEWQLQDSLAVKSIIDYHNSNTPQNERNPIVPYPIGVDSKKRNYWQFGDSCWIWREKPHYKATYEWETVCKNRQELEQLVNTLSSSNRAEKALIKVIEEEIYEIAKKEERKKERKERAELRKLIPVEVSITPTQLRSRGSRNERVRYNYDDDIYGIEEDEDNEDNEVDDDDFEEEEQETSNRRSSRRKAPVEAPAPTRWSSRLHKSTEDMTDALEEIGSNVNSVTNLDSQKVNIDDDMMDTTPITSEMDTRSPSVSNMDTTPSESDMETSRSQSFMDTSRPPSVMEEQ